MALKRASCSAVSYEIGRDDAMAARRRLDGEHARAGADVGDAQARRRARDHLEQRVGLGPDVLHVLEGAAELEHVEALADAANSMLPFERVIVAVDQPEGAQFRRQRRRHAADDEPRRRRIEERIEAFGVVAGERAQRRAEPRISVAGAVALSIYRAMLQNAS